MQILPTKASSKDDEESSLPYDYGKSELPPMYVDIQEDVEKNLINSGKILSIKHLLDDNLLLTLLLVLLSIVLESLQMLIRPTIMKLLLFIVVLGLVEQVC